MRSTILTLTLAITAAASADLYTLNFGAQGSPLLLDQINGQLTLAFDDPINHLSEEGAYVGSFQEGTFRGTMETVFGSATAFGGVFEDAISPGASIFVLIGTMQFEDRESIEFDFHLFPEFFAPPGVMGFGMAQVGHADDEIFMTEWSIAAVPAPGALALIGLAGLGRRRRT